MAACRPFRATCGWALAYDALLSAQPGRHLLVAITDEDLHRVVVGLMALTYRETHGGSGYESDESAQAMSALHADLLAYKIGIQIEPGESSEAFAYRVAEATGNAVGLQMFKALHSAIIAFVEFCDLAKQDSPSLDVEDLLARLALRAASDVDADE